MAQVSRHNIMFNFHRLGLQLFAADKEVGASCLRSSPCQHKAWPCHSHDLWDFCARMVRRQLWQCSQLQPTCWTTATAVSRHVRAVRDKERRCNVWGRACAEETQADRRSKASINRSFAWRLLLRSKMCLRAWASKHQALIKQTHAKTYDDSTAQ